MIKIFEKGDPITLEDVKKFEVRFDITIPEPYRSFLLESNGGRPEPDGIDIDGLSGEETDVAWFKGLKRQEESNTIASTLETIRQGYPHKHVIPMASDSCGGIFCLDLEGEGHPVIYFEAGGAWQDEPYEPLYVASDFEAFLDMIHD